MQNKQIISLVVAMNQDRVIGTNNQLPWQIPEDLKLFKQITWGKPIIMGRKTFESIARPLPGRKNIVLSRSLIKLNQIFSFQSLDQAIQANLDAPEICIIGGGEIFKEAIAIANKLYLTLVDFPMVTNPCAWFPAIDTNCWELLTQHDFLSTIGIKCTHQVLKKVA
jgi:dihydrofolate reductase